MGELIGLIIFGAIIGALARLFMKGEQPIGVLWTIILGVLGALAGYWIRASWESTTPMASTGSAGSSRSSCPSCSSRST